MKQENRLVWVAEDGKMFERANDCRLYEYGLYLEKWKAVPKIRIETGMTEGSMDEFYVVACRNSLDVENANQYLNHISDDKMTFIGNNDIGNRIIVCLWGERTGCNRIGSVSDEMTRLAKATMIAEPQIGGE